jgi:hypothetical protein
MGQTGGIILFSFMLGLICIVTTFGVGTAVNMLFRKVWVSLVIAVLLSIWLLIASKGSLTVLEWVLFGIGWIGTMLSTWAVNGLKKRGYALFT